jgi:hypothetical protein
MDHFSTEEVIAHEASYAILKYGDEGVLKKMKLIY